MLVAVQLSVPGLYLPPVLKDNRTDKSTPDDHLATGPDCRMLISALGALARLVAIQLSMVGLYRPPVFKYTPEYPPQTIISLPVQTAVNSCRPSGALMVLVAVQLSVPGLYLPPVFKLPLPLYPPQTIISLPVHTAVWPVRASARWLCWWQSSCRCWDCTSRRCSDR